MGAQISKYYGQIKQYLKSKTPAEQAYLVFASSIIVAQATFLTLHTFKLGKFAPTLSSGIKKSLLYLVPAVSAVFAKKALSSEKDTSNSYFEMVKNSSSAVKFASLSAFSLLMGFVTLSQVRILKGKQGSISPAVVYSLLGTTIGLPFCEKLYHKYKESKKIQCQTQEKEAICN